PRSTLFPYTTLFRSDRLALAHRQVPHRRARVLAIAEDLALLLARQIDAGPSPEAEPVDPVVESLPTELHPDRVGPDVARLLEDLRDGARLVAAGLGVVDLPVRDREHGGKEELGVGHDDSILEGSRDGDRLERRARLVVEG